MGSLFEKWSKEGMKFPFAHDPVTDKPSVTLLFVYLTFIVMIICITVSSGALLIKGEYYLAVIPSVIVWSLSYIFYRLRKLDKVKFDLENKSIELDSGDDTNEDK